MSDETVVRRNWWLALFSAFCAAEFFTIANTIYAQRWHPATFLIPDLVAFELLVLSPAFVLRPEIERVRRRFRRTKSPSPAPTNTARS
jgi:hypothetical protein